MSSRVKLKRVCRTFFAFLLLLKSNPQKRVRFGQIYPSDHAAKSSMVMLAQDIYFCLDLADNY